MAFARNKVDKIRQIVRLKQLMRHWRALGIRRRPVISGLIPAGFLAVYVGAERRRFVIPTRYVNLPIFAPLLKKAEEEFGFQALGGLILPCEVEFFKGVLKILEENERRFRGSDLGEILNLFSEVDFDSCKEGSTSCNGFTPRLQKVRA